MMNLRTVLLTLSLLVPAASVQAKEVKVVETPVSKLQPGDLGGTPIPPVAEALAEPIGFCRRAN